MSPHPKLVRAVITATLAATTEQTLRNMMSEQEQVRIQAEDAIVDRIMDALNKCELGETKATV